MTDYGHPLEFGTFITPLNARAEDVVGLAVLTEQTGLDLVTVQDHPYQPRFLDAWTLLTFVAARTSRISLAANVTNVPLRPPAVLARIAVSLDILSGGRVELGLGAGGFWDAIEAMGGPRRRPGEAVQALEEAIAVIRGIWDVESSGPLVVDGQFYHLHGAKRGPRPPHPINLWIGAQKPRMLALIGARADGWLPTLDRIGGDEALVAGNEIIDAAAREHGRDPAAVRRLLNIHGEFSAVPRGRLRGPARQWAQDLAELALGAGVGTFILASDAAADIEGFAAEVVPATRELVAAERAGQPAADRTPVARAAFVR